MIARFGWQAIEPDSIVSARWPVRLISFSV
jgi:hypothetical protein